MKITSSYLKQVIKEELEAELEQESKAKAGLAAGLALISSMALMSAKEQVDRLRELNRVARIEFRNAGYDELAEFYEKETGSSAEQDRMDLEDLKLFAAGQKLGK